MKKAITVGVYNPRHIHQASPYCGDQVFANGLEANGYKVTRIDYRAEPEPNQRLLEISEQIKPDIFWFGKCERILPETIEQLRSMHPGAVFVKWAADVRIEPTEHDLAHNKHIDYFFGTFGGDYLKKHLLPNMKGVCSIIAFTDSDYYKDIKPLPEWESDILWTGTKSTGNNDLRNEVIDKLLKYKNARVYGLSGWLGDPEYLYAINSTKIGIGVNSFNHTVKWSSDRLGNYMACGTFYLCHNFGNIDKIFKRGYHLDWFDTVEEMEEKIQYYLKNERERKMIAKRGQAFILRYFDYKPLVKNLLNVIETGKSGYKWDDIYMN